MNCVKKRNGALEEISFDKVTRRIKYLCTGYLRDGTCIGPALNINYSEIAKKVIAMITDRIETRVLDDYAAEYCGAMIVEDYQYGILGGRIAVSNHQKNTLGSLTDTVRLLYENKDQSNVANPLVSRNFYKDVMAKGAEFNAIIRYERDFRFNYFGFSTLLESCLLKGCYVIERPQHMYMRLAIAFHGTNVERVKETYDLLSLGYYTHASPTMFNAGTLYPQMSSCFLLGIGDSMDTDGGIPDCWKACSRISKRSGGIGIGLQPIRGEGSLIRSTNGLSSGIKPLLKIFNDISKYVNQGGRRPGAFAVYLEPWHPDIESFINAKKATGLEDDRARDLFYGLMIPDIFMRRVIEAHQRSLAGQTEPVYWSLMCPDKCPGLYQTYGEEFDRLYLSYEHANKITKRVDIYQLWKDIMASQKETGVPYMLFKDNINKCNNQANLGVIRNSNLCCEIVEYSDETEYAVCNLASISLIAFLCETESPPLPVQASDMHHVERLVITKDTRRVSVVGNISHLYFDLNKLFEVAQIAHRNLDMIIDINVYPVPQAHKSNMRHRPVGLGVQGLADVFQKLGLSYESPEAQELNKLIFETIYFGSMTASVALAQEREERMVHLKHNYQHLFNYEDEYGLCATVYSDIEPSDQLACVSCDLEDLRPIKEELERETYLGAYASFIGSPLSQGKFQFDLWKDKPSSILAWDWDGLRTKLLQYGARNSLTTCVMPTASTAQILGNTECIEPYKYNLYTRRVKAGEFIIINENLQKDLQHRNLWNAEVRAHLEKHRGSIQNLDLPSPDAPHLKELYKTAFEIKMKTVLQMSRDRSPFIDQTQSLNMFVSKPTNAILHNIFVLGWQMGLKTGMYYLRREPICNPVQFTVCKACEA